MQRSCFLLQVKKGKLQDYMNAHDVWKNAGLHNYSMFYRSDGLLVGYLEGEDIQKSFQTLGNTGINKRWQEYMSEYFESSGDLRGSGVEFLKEYFHMP